MDFGSSGSGVVRESLPYQVNNDGEEDQNGDRFARIEDYEENYFPTPELLTSTALWDLYLSLKDVTLLYHSTEQILTKHRMFPLCLTTPIEV